jgi:thiol-disulfide isomerase/thioredoxin
MRKFLAALLCTAALLVAQQAPRRAPGFCLVDSRGQWRDLADYRGKPVIVEFLQTNCPHCAAFVPILDKARQKYGDRIAILAIVLPPDNPATMTEYVSGHGITYPVLLDQGQVAASYVRAPRLSFPTIYLVDPEGMIHDHFTYGAMTRDIFEGNGLENELERMMGSSARNHK